MPDITICNRVCDNFDCTRNFECYEQVDEWQSVANLEGTDLCPLTLPDQEERKSE